MVNKVAPAPATAAGLNTSHNSSINKSGGGGKKKRVKRLSDHHQNAYYLSAFISNPCEQLFGPSLSYALDLNSSSSDNKDKSLTNDSNLGEDLETSAKSEQQQQQPASEPAAAPATSSKQQQQPPSPPPPPPSLPVTEDRAAAAENVEPTAGVHESSFEYIPAPRWNKAQNSILEELFKKSRYPKTAELKQTAQRLHVMDTDVEEWFRKRRGRDRKTRRKNEALKNLIDNYLDK